MLNVGVHDEDAGVDADESVDDDDKVDLVGCKVNGFQFGCLVVTRIRLRCFILRKIIP
jgi:hypothetical protein